MKDLHPEKLYVELTTRCNLHCQMCVKFAAGSCIAEGDMPLDIFKKLSQSLSHIHTLVLNGIGEPLLHPDLEEIVALAHSHMPSGGVIGFQSNGFLLDKHRAVSLMQAGLGTICLSLDSLNLDTSDGHAFFAVSRAIEVLIQARRQSARPFRIGIEMVLNQETISGLPDLVRWAAGQEVDYLIATHLFLYGGASENASLFNPNSTDAVDIFNKYSSIAASQGVKIDNYLATYLKFTKTPSDQKVLQLVDAMLKEAKGKDIHLHLQSLLEHRIQNLEEIEQSFHEARNIAKAHGIELFLPPLHADTQRSCPFVTENATFIASNGDVMPCHFLWHTYSCRVLGESIQVQERVFGNIRQQSLESIWQSAEYRQFRQEAEGYEYASCWSCSLGPCPTLINDSLYANDCYGSIVPCGHCQWSLGGIRCL